jgi:hypothetical protein
LDLPSSTFDLPSPRSDSPSADHTSSISSPLRLLSTTRLSHFTSQARYVISTFIRRLLNENQRRSIT